MLIGSIYSIVLSSNILIKEEYNRTAEFLLSKPLTRREIILTKWAVSVVNIVLLNIFTGTVGYFSILLVKTGAFAFSSFFILTVYTFLLNILFGALGLFIPTMIKRPRQVTSMSVGIVILFYFIYTISKITESAGKFGYVSPFKFVNVEVLSPGYRIGFWHLLYFIGLSVLFTLVAIIKYQRKDIYT
jgi:ABC-2 type transport system permease protein